MDVNMVTAMDESMVMDMVMVTKVKMKKKTNKRVNPLICFYVSMCTPLFF